MTENGTSITGLVTAVLTANGFSDARDTSAPRRGPAFVVEGGVDAVVTISWGPSSPEDYEFLAEYASTLRGNGFAVEDRRSYLIVRDPAGQDA